MSYKSLGLLVVVLLCGAISSFLVKSALLDTVPAVPVASQEETTPILVSLSDLPVGTEISPKNVKFIQYPKDKVSRETITGFSEIDKRRIIRPVRANSPISLYDLELEPEVVSEQLAFLPPGYVVVPIRIDSISSSGGISELTPFVRPEELLTPGDKVTVALVYEESLNNPWERNSKDEQAHRPVTKTLLEEVEVYESSLQRATSQEQGLDNVAVVSLLLNQDDAAMVKSVAKSGKLRLVPGDRKADESNSVVAEKLDRSTVPATFQSSVPPSPTVDFSHGNPDKITVEPTLVAQTPANEAVAPKTSGGVGAGNATFLTDKPSGTDRLTEKNSPEAAVSVPSLPVVRPMVPPFSSPGSNDLNGNDTFLNQDKPDGVTPSDSRPKQPANRSLLPSTAPRSPVDYTMVNKKETTSNEETNPSPLIPRP